MEEQVMRKNALFPAENILKTELFAISQDCEVPIPAFFIIAPVIKGLTS